MELSRSNFSTLKQESESSFLRSSFSTSSLENDNLKSKFSTSSWGGTRKLPYVFTEQGVYMLMTVLKGELATKQSKALVRLQENEGLRYQKSAAIKKTCYAHTPLGW